MDAYTYLVAGKRFSASNLTELKQQLSAYGLVANLDERGFGSFSTRRMSDPEKTDRYRMLPHHNGFNEDAMYDVVVGLQIGNTLIVGSRSEIEIDMQAIRKAMNKVKKDIPDAKVMIVSYLD